MTTWEYQTIAISESKFGKFEHELNALGAQGWEAVSMFGIKKGIGSDQVGILLKRPTLPPPPQQP